MLCKELMKHDVDCVSPRDTAEDAAAKMRDDNIGFLPVCDQSQKVLGTLTDRDLALRVIGGKRSGQTPVEEIMTRDVVACSPDDDVAKAEDLMEKHHKSRIICLDDKGFLAGVISLSDIAQREPERASEVLRHITEREARA